MRLSVVVPAYNVAGYIGATLKSLSVQTHPVFEVIVVNDGSTDGTVQEIETSAAAFPLPRFQLVHQDNAGVSAARNRGLSSASGDYVLFLDGDDVVSTDLVRTLTQDAVSWEQRPDVLCWGYRRDNAASTDLREPDHPIPSSRISGPQALRRVLVDHDLDLAMHSMAWRVRFLVDAGLLFTPRLGAGQDTEFRWRAMAIASQVRIIDAALSTYVWRATSTTNSPGLKQFDGFLAYDRAARLLERALRDEYRDVVRVANSRTVERFMGHFVIHCRSYNGGSMLLLRDLEERHPGIIAAAQAAIRRQNATQPVDHKARLFLLSPRIAGRYFQSRVSQSSPSGAVGFAVKSVRHMRRRTLGRAVRARIRGFRTDVGLRRAAVRLRREGPHEDLLITLSQAWGNATYSADLSYLREVIERGQRASTILECGSGLTTVALGTLGKEVWTLEHDQHWFARLLRVLKVTRIRQVRALHAPLTEYGDFDWYSIPEQLPEDFDLVICDGPPGHTRGGRSGLFRLMSGQIQTATVLLDDVHRPQEQELLQELASEGWTYDIRGTGDKRYAVLRRILAESASGPSGWPQP